MTLKKICFTLFVLTLFFVLIIASNSSATLESPQADTPKNRRIYLVYIAGKSTLMGCSAGIHLTPLWFQLSSGWISYGFDGTTLLIINGEPIVTTNPIRVYMESFKGIAPGFIHWKIKSTLSTRIRLLGVCSNLEIHDI